MWAYYAIPGQTNNCPAAGHITYSLVRAAAPTQAQQTAYNLITEAMNKALSYYNCYTSFNLNISVYYDSGVPTAQANWNGPISFGQQAYMNYITAMHEISHCLGVGTYSRWSGLISNGIYTGSNATNQLRALTGNATEQLKGDTQQFSMSTICCRKYYMIQ